MFKFLKKEESIEVPVINQLEDWTKEIKRSQKIGQEVEQLSFIYDNNKDNLILGTKKGLSLDHLKIIKNCKNESSAIELMEILNRSNKSKFKNTIINPLVVKVRFKGELHKELGKLCMRMPTMMNRDS